MHIFNNVAAVSLCDCTLHWEPGTENTNPNPPGGKSGHMRRESLGTNVSVNDTVRGISLIVARTHLALHVRQLFSVLGVEGVGQQGVQVDARLLLTVFFVLDLVMKQSTARGMRATRGSDNCGEETKGREPYLAEHVRLLSDKLSLQGFWHQVVQTAGVSLWTLLVLQLEKERRMNINLCFEKKMRTKKRNTFSSWALRDLQRLRAVARYMLAFVILSRNCMLPCIIISIMSLKEGKQESQSKSSR